MKKFLVLLLGLGICIAGCSGASTYLLKRLTGIELEEQADGRTIVHEGTKAPLIIERGTHARFPEDFPLPQPSFPATLDSVSVQGDQTIVSYSLNGNGAQAMAFYREAMEAKGIEPEVDEQKWLVVKTTLARGDLEHGDVVVTLIEMPMLEVLTLIWTR